MLDCLEATIAERITQKNYENDGSDQKNKHIISIVDVVIRTVRGGPVS